MLFRIIYSSRATHFLNDDELRELCETSTQRNLRDGITGLFLYDGVRFLQAIEGERPAVESLMARIVRNRNHRDIVEVFAGAIEHREFPHWSMDEPPRQGEDLEKFVEQVKADVSLVADPHMRAQFIGFARLASKRRIA
ncbi:MAG: BLUF domain-containing protein [Sphingomonas phyllosphaerae]